MTNRELINMLMEFPLDATVSIDCGCCAHVTFYSNSSRPKITCSGGTYKTLSIRTNEGFENESLNMSLVSNSSLLDELNKRMEKRES